MGITITVTTNGRQDAYKIERLELYDPIYNSQSQFPTKYSVFENDQNFVYQLPQALQVPGKNSIIELLKHSATAILQEQYQPSDKPIEIINRFNFPALQEDGINCGPLCLSMTRWIFQYLIANRPIPTTFHTAPYDRQQQIGEIQRTAEGRQLIDQLKEDQILSEKKSSRACDRNHIEPLQRSQLKLFKQSIGEPIPPCFIQIINLWQQQLLNLLDCSQFEKLRNHLSLPKNSTDKVTIETYLIRKHSQF